MMEALVDEAEFAIGDVSVNLSGGNIGMTKKELHCSQIGAIT